MTAIPVGLKRADVPHEQTWNRESLFESWDAFQKELDSTAALLPELEASLEKLQQSADVLADWLAGSMEVRRRVARMAVYTAMGTAVDTGDIEAKARYAQIISLAGKMAAMVASGEAVLLDLGETLLEWADGDARLKVYRHYFHNLLRQKPHTRSPEVEKVLGMVQDPFAGVSQTYQELVSSDMKFAAAQDSLEQLHAVAQAIVPPSGIQSRDRTLRRNAWYSFCDEHRAMQNTLASNLITSVRQQVFMARVRGYASVLEMQLAPANLPVEIFHNLINTFKDNLPVWHRYWEAKRKILGVDALHPYDIWAPIVEDEPRVSYEQAVDWICSGLQALGDTYVAVMRRGCLEERWVDRAQNEGRGQGAFSCAAYDCHPFVFNTFDGGMMAVSVLAHELGHSMHAYLTDQHQPEVYNGFFAAGGSSAVSETASNFHQAMVRAHLMQAKADDKNFQLAVIDEAMFNFHRYFFIMPTLARFEHEVYARAEHDQPLNADILNGIMKDFYADGYGSTMSDEPDRTAITWAEFGHLYQPFYTFQYSVGISAAHALAEGILAGEPDAAKNYLSMLGAGWSMYAPDLFKLAGVDMTSPAPIEKTFAVLASLVQRLESLAEA